MPIAEVAAYDAERDADGRLVVNDPITRLLQAVLVANGAAHLLERPTF